MSILIVLTFILSFQNAILNENHNTKSDMDLLSERQQLVSVLLPCDNPKSGFLIMKTKFKIVCKGCGKGFYVNNKQKDVRKYCTLACFNKQKRTPGIKRCKERKEKQCLQCGVSYLVKTRRFNETKFCSKSCSSKFHYLDYLEAGFTMKNRIPYNKKYDDPKEAKRIHQKNLLKKNVVYKLSQRMSINIYDSLKGRKRSESIFNLLGYTIEDLKTHLESQFLDSMSWNNWGRYGWHIDHIRPISSFSFKSVDDEGFKQCWSLSNLRPLWAFDNLSKHDKL